MAPVSTPAAVYTSGIQMTEIKDSDLQIFEGLYCQQGTTYKKDMAFLDDFAAQITAIVHQGPVFSDPVQARFLLSPRGVPAQPLHSDGKATQTQNNGIEDNLMEFDSCDVTQLLAGDCIVERLEDGEISASQDLAASLTPSKRQRSKSSKSGFPPAGKQKQGHQVVFGLAAQGSPLPSLSPGKPSPSSRGKIIDEDGFTLVTSKKSLRLAGKPTTFTCL